MTNKVEIARSGQRSRHLGKKLSLWRLLLALAILAGISISVFFGVNKWQDSIVLTSTKPWFAPYVDVTATPAFAFEQIDSSESPEAVLSFVVSLPSDTCTPSWGGAYTLEQADSSLDLDRRIARLRQRGGNVSVSFGGLNNYELAVKCTDTAKLKKAYRSVIEKYDIDTIDLDLEETGLSDTEAGVRRAKVIAELQSERRDKGNSLAVWATLPVTPLGLSEDGTNAVTVLLENGVDLAGVNAMTMDYGQSLEAGTTMLEGSLGALKHTKRQLGILYQQVGIYLNEATLWTKIGATPMVGQNDITEEVFTIEYAKELNRYALSQNIGRMSMWSANRDVACGDNYVNLKVPSDSCSGVDASKQSFARALGAGFEGSLSLRAGIVTVTDTKVDYKEPDDPATSPYQIWSEEGTYLKGTKVVWRRNVYEAKWWTQNEIPDDPILNAWETPWELIGPVLPGEKPIKQATLPAGTYPEWSGTVNYESNERILFMGVPYQAKWWNQGQSPAGMSSNPDSSPWVPLTQSQINEVINSSSN